MMTRSGAKRPCPPSPLGSTLQVLILRCLPPTAFLPLGTEFLSPKSPDYSPILIKITHFPQAAPHLALNSREPTGEWGLGGYIEDRLGGYSGGGPGLGEGSG